MSQSSVTFGKVKVGTAKTKVVTLTDTAPRKGGSTVSFSGVTLSGSSDFSEWTTCTGAVPPKWKCTVTLGFTPSVSGPENATVTINSNAANSPNVIGIRGIGKLPAIGGASPYYTRPMLGMTMDRSHGCISTQVLVDGFPNLAAWAMAPGIEVFWWLVGLARKGEKRKSADQVDLIAFAVR
ncbi:MAG: choice-of-anchor D domain-containing protein [Candidatus Binataceae bacterium]